MADFILVDAHVHLYRTQEEGHREKTGYQVWEYGDQADVHETDCVGTVGEPVSYTHLTLTTSDLV